MIKFYLSIIILISVSCNFHKVQKGYRPSVKVEDKFSLYSSPKKKEVLWYKQFSNNEINKLVQEALTKNLNLKSVYAVLEKARLNVQVNSSSLSPKLDLSIRSLGQQENPYSSSSLAIHSFNLTGTSTLSWEIDFWRKAKAQSQAALASYEASAEDYKNAALVLSTSVVKLYFDLLMAKQMAKIIEKQNEINQKIYEITKTRKLQGQAKFIDIQQQKELLLSKQTEFLENQKNINTLEHSLAILLSISPIKYKFEAKNILPELPPIPKIPSPQTLLESNPQLRSKLKTLRAIDYNIAVQLAKRFPSLNISSNYSLNNLDTNPEDNQNLNLSINLTKNLFDAGKESAEYKISKLNLKKELLSFSESYLSFIRDVENALAKEKYLKKQLSIDKNRIQLASNNVKDAEFNYSNNSGSYIDVLNKINALQNIKKQKLRTQRNLLEARISLHLALGDNVLKRENNE